MCSVSSVQGLQLLSYVFVDFVKRHSATVGQVGPTTTVFGNASAHRKTDEFVLTPTHTLLATTLLTSLPAYVPAHQLIWHVYLPSITSRIAVFKKLSSRNRLRSFKGN